MSNLNKILSDHFCFKGLHDADLQNIISRASEVRFSEGDFIFSEDDVADRFYIILEGRVALETKLAPDRDPITIQTLGANDVLGWAWLFPPHTAHFDARALDDTRAISLDGDYIRNMCEENHDLGYELFKRFTKVMQQRLHAVKLQNPDMYVVKSKP